MQFIIKSNPAQSFEVSDKKAFELLAEAYNVDLSIGDKKEQDASSIKAFVRQQQHNKTALSFETKKLKGLPFPAQFSGVFVDGATPKVSKFKLTKVTLNPDTEFSKVCQVLLQPKVSYADRFFASNRNSKIQLKNILVVAAAIDLYKVVKPLLMGFVPALLLTPVAFGLSALGFSIAADALRSYLKRSNFEVYKAKDADAVAALTDNQVQAFSDGVEAQKNYLSYFRSFVSVKDYRHGNAFYAGMGAAKNNDADVIAKVMRP